MGSHSGIGHRVRVPGLGEIRVEEAAGSHGGSGAKGAGVAGVEGVGAEPMDGTGSTTGARKGKGDS